MEFLHRTWAEISKSALIYNFEQIEKRAAGAEIMAVVKADAYGHGDKIVSPVLEECGADMFAVSNIDEAKSLREYGVEKPILILGYTPVECVKDLYDNDISQCVYSRSYAVLLSQAAKESGGRVKVHIKFDTGMSRLGFDLRDDSLSGADDAAFSAKLPNFCVEGVFTHFAAADSDKSECEEFTEGQYNRFMRGVERLRACGVNPTYLHCDNSAGLCGGKHSLDIVRPGIILYGLKPDKDFNTRLELKPVMTLKSVVSFVKTVKKGTPVSYGMTYTANEDMKIATVAAGYADGYPRLASNKGEVLIRGKRAKIVGRVCMDQMIVDVSDIDGVKMGDEVILFGNDISVDEIAGICGTINYEIVCGIAPRVPRVLVE